MIIPSTTLGVSGKFRLVLSRDKAGRDVKYETEFDNLVTDAGLERLISSASGAAFASTYGRFAIGTSGATPAQTDEELGAQVAMLGSNPALSYSSSYTNRLFEITAYGQFAPGAVSANVNLQEIGLRSTDTGNKLFCRALILDSGGGTTSIPFGPNDYLGCYYTLQYKMPANDIVYNGVMIDRGDGAEPTATTITIRPHRANNWNSSVPLYILTNAYRVDFYSGGLVAATSTSTPTGSVGYIQNGTPGVTWGWDKAGKYRKLIYSFPLDRVNSDNIATLVCEELFGYWQVNFNPPLKKTSSQTMTITLYQSFTRA